MLEEFYGIDCSAFPLRSHLVTRTLEGQNNMPKRLYYISEGVKAYLLKDEGEQLKVTSTGLKVFERQQLRDGSGASSYRWAAGWGSLCARLLLQGVV